MAKSEGAVLRSALCILHSAFQFIIGFQSLVAGFYVLVGFYGVGLLIHALRHFTYARHILHLPKANFTSAKQILHSRFAVGRLRQSAKRFVPAKQACRISFGNGAAVPAVSADGEFVV